MASDEKVPMPSLGHELGIMFGFMGAMLLSMIIYGFAWNRGNKISLAKEQARVNDMRAKGLLDEKDMSPN